MLLLNVLRSPEAGKIRLNDWDRAPGALVYLEPPPRPEADRAVELFISSYAPELWSDLWQLDLVIRDTPGILMKLATFLRERKVSPISLETSSFDNGERHKVSLLCDCRAYGGGELDVSWKERTARGRMELLELHAALAAEFVEHLIFVNGADPILSLRRNEGHFRAHKRMVQRKRQTESARIDRGWLRLPSAIIKRIEEILEVKLGTTRYLAVSDAEDRVVRIHFFSERSAIVHVRALFDGPTELLVSETLRSLSQRGFDVLGSRLRSGLRSIAALQTDTETLVFGSLDLFLRLPPELISWTTARLDHLFAHVATDLESATGSHIRLSLVASGGKDDRSDTQGHTGEAVAPDRGRNARGSGWASGGEGGRGDADPLPHVPSKET